jgi:hypothetical protein
LWIGQGYEVGAGPLLGGTVLSIDHEAPSISLLMPRGDARLFTVSNRSLLKDIKVGDHVTLEVDGEGKITKLTKLPVDAGN